MSSVVGRWAASLSVALALVFTVGTSPARAGEPKPPCTPGDPNCVIIGTGDPGGPGNPGGGTGDPGGGGPTQPDPCLPDTGYAYIACRSIGIVGLDVCVPIFEQNEGTLTLADLNTLLVANGCPPAPANLVPPSPADLALRALAGFRLPSPSGHRSPSETLDFNGYPFTYVNLWLFFWTDPGSWKSLSATARAGGNWATVTAKPVSLSYDPGDGSPLVACDGPGRPWTDADGNSAPSDGACGYQYQHVTSQPVTSTQTITWQLSWVGSGGTGGTFPDRSTSTSGQLQVMQIQTVVVRR
jgi:hypothetical protein